MNDLPRQHVSAFVSASTYAIVFSGASVYRVFWVDAVFLIVLTADNDIEATSQLRPPRDRLDRPPIIVDARVPIVTWLI